MTDGPRRRRIAYLTYSTGQFDSRTQRMATSAIAAGYHVVVYARWEPGLPLESSGPGYRIVRVPVVARLAIPGLRRGGRQQLAAIKRRALEASSEMTDMPERPAVAGPGPGTTDDAPSTNRQRVDRVPRPLRGRWFGWPARQAKAAWRDIGRARRRLTTYPIRPMAWAVALDDVVEPADIWHGMWATSLPALARSRRLHGGRTLYDSRDIFLHARGMEGMGRLWAALLGGLERRWARGCDAVLTVNDAYAEILERQLGVPRPQVVRNTPARYTRLSPTPDLFREHLGLPPSTRIVLYQGGLMSDRGIEQGMDAILEVPDAVLVLMGFGSQEASIERLARSERYASRVRMVEPAPPEDLLDWTASSDVMLMAIQPSSLNHRFTTPNKLWEAIAAGVPVVASDLPGMARVVRASGCGELVDPTDPADIARGLRLVLDGPPDERAARLARCRAAGETNAWEHEVGTLLSVYGRLDRPAPDA